jgi:hypothetical protein
MLSLLTKTGLIVAIFAVQLVCSAKIADSPKVEKEMQNLEEVSKQPKLEVAFNASETSLEVTYKVKNTTSSDIYLFNVIMHTDQPDTLSPHKFYSCIRDDGTLVLAKMIPKLPSIGSVEFREIPYVTKVEAGKEFSEKEVLPLPLEEYSPYFQKNAESKTEVRLAERGILVVQFIRQKDGLEVKETKIPNAFSVWHQNLFGNVETLSTDSRPVGVKVDRRLDTFERF